jgi:hypothetical protein
LPAPDAPTIAVVFPASATKDELVQHPAAGRIGEVDAVELDAAGGNGERHCAGDITLLHFHVEQFIDHARIDHGALQR